MISCWQWNIQVSDEKKKKCMSEKLLKQILYLFGQKNKLPKKNENNLKRRKSRKTGKKEKD